MAVKIISDSTSDLTAELKEKYNIDIIPLHVLLGEEEYLDGMTITPDEIYKWADENKTTPKTSAINFEETVEKFKYYLDKGDDIVCFSAPGKMSTTFNVMRMAAEELDAQDRIFVVDTKSLSAGSGLIVIKAAELAEEGKTAKEIYDYMEDYVPKSKCSFIIDTLVYLHRGGRCSGVAALVGGALKLHPKIVVDDGVMTPSKKYRGNINLAIMNYVKDMEEDIRNADSKRVIIAHSGCSEELIKQVYDYVKSLNDFEEIIVTRAGCVISSHCGPNTLGVIYQTK